MRPLAIAASGGAEQGLGHVLRAASLAREALSRGIAVSFHIAGDDGVRCLAAKEAPEASLLAWDGVSDVSMTAPGELSLLRILRLARSASSPISADNRRGAIGDSPAYSSRGLK